MHSRNLSLKMSLAAGLTALSSFAALHAGVTFYTTDSSFTAAAPALTLQDFSSVNTFGQPTAVFPEPFVTSTTGLTLTTLNPGSPSTAIYVEGSGSSPKAVGTNWFQDTLILNFAPTTSAVGENVFGNLTPGQNLAGTVMEQVFDGTTLLGSTTINEATGTGGFIGVTSTGSNITSIDLFFNPTADTDSNTFVTDVAFAAAPEPSAWCLELLSLGLLAFFSLRRPARS